MRLRIHEDALWVAEQVYAIAEVVGRKDRNLADQMRRSMSSTVLNLGEGAYASGGNRPARWTTALSAASETRCALQLAQTTQKVAVSEEMSDRIDKVIATLWKLTR